MSDLRSYLKMRMENDFHPHQAKQQELGGMRCEQIDDPINNVVVGDFLYYYSDQLDAFTLSEVVSVDRDKAMIETVLIDTDSPEVEDSSPHKYPLKTNHCEQFYRPTIEDRYRAERNGFQSMYMPLFPGMTREIQRRHLVNKLYYKPAWKQVIMPDEKGSPTNRAAAAVLAVVIAVLFALPLALILHWPWYAVSAAYAVAYVIAIIVIKEIQKS